MTIILSCGHAVDDFSDEQMVAVKDYSKDWSRAVAYRTVCKECLKAYQDEDAILYTEEAEMEWLTGRDEETQ